MNHSSEEFLGVDVGSAKVGIARGSGLARLAEPLKSVPAAAAFDELRTLAKTAAAAGLVVGLPRSLDGNDTGQTQAVRDWANRAQLIIKLPFYWQDEALTSQKAQSLKPKAESSFDEHALAAAVTLQDFLDTPKDQRVRC